MSAGRFFTKTGERSKSPQVKVEPVDTRFPPDDKVVLDQGLQDGETALAMDTSKMQNRGSIHDHILGSKKYMDPEEYMEEMKKRHALELAEAIAGGGERKGPPSHKQTRARVIVVSESDEDEAPSGFKQGDGAARSAEAEANELFYEETTDPPVSWKLS